MSCSSIRLAKFRAEVAEGGLADSGTGIRPGNERNTRLFSTLSERHARERGTQEEATRLPLFSQPEIEASAAAAMGNSQFNGSKDGEGGTAGEDGGYSTYPETRTAPGAPGPFSDAGFAPSLRIAGDTGRSVYSGGRAASIGGACGPGGAAAGDDMEVESKTDGGNEEELVPTVFRWEHGGGQVYITGTFNNWEKQIPMHRSGNDFTYIHTLKKGKHAFKFIVDDEWRFAPDQPTVADIEGRVNNFIDVSDFVGYTGEENFEANRMKVAEGNDQYGQSTPDLDEYTKEPPPLPPHLRHIILNKNPPANDPSALPVPQHVALNHLYCTAIKDGMMVLGMTERYKQKFVTTVYYSTMPG